jgi:isopenicillin-N N-acyltransferase-like protein
MYRKRWYKRWWFILLITLMALLTAGAIYLYVVAIVHPPQITDQSALALERTETSPGFYTIGNNWFRKSKSGLYEMYTEGNAFERGVINGKLAKELIVRQEDHFNSQIQNIIPSTAYLHFLKYFIGWFNRDLDDHVLDEYKEEIYGISFAASHDYDYIGSGNACSIIMQLTTLDMPSRVSRWWVARRLRPGHLKSRAAP